MSIKRMNPKQTFEIISETDSSLIRETDEELLAPSDENSPAVKKPSRFERYVENANFDESILKFKDGEKPDKFIMKTLTSDDRAELSAKYTYIDPVAKRVVFTNNQKMMLDSFAKTYQGVKHPDGTIEKIPADELPYEVQIEMGAIINLVSNLGKNEKKS